jgi:hypothetical protein
MGLLSAIKGIPEVDMESIGERIRRRILHLRDLGVQN